ncbi:hypothetical protein DSO57_1018208 [Entomophthora muscae]|uniref:Uncharacterized protein n=1 Tax=Entomophthora muscae TaxID=34485 RepID=A0ACC2RVF0_9FUNG|nr:hypothetical protein DSO57_1018208 [Entomophthora muscae]
MSKMMHIDTLSGKKVKGKDVTAEDALYKASEPTVGVLDNCEDQGNKINSIEQSRSRKTQLSDGDIAQGDFEAEIGLINIVENLNWLDKLADKDLEAL